MSDTPAIPGMNVGLGIAIGDLLTHEPTCLSGIVVDIDLASGLYTLMDGDAMPIVHISPVAFGMWWEQSRNSGTGFEVIKHATHDPKLLRQGIVRERRTADVPLWP